MISFTGFWSIWHYQTIWFKLLKIDHDSYCFMILVFSQQSVWSKTTLLLARMAMIPYWIKTVVSQFYFTIRRHIILFQIVYLWREHLKECAKLAYPMFPVCIISLSWLVPLKHRCTPLQHSLLLMYYNILYYFLSNTWKSAKN